MFVRQDGSIRWFRVVLGISALVIFLGVWGSFTGLIGRWLEQPAQVLSPENVRAQWEFAYTYTKSLDAIALQICQAEKAVVEAIGDNAKTQRQSQLLAYQNNYYRVQAEYDAALSNAFKAKLVRPPDVPEQAPTLEITKLRICPQ